MGQTKNQAAGAAGKQLRTRSPNFPAISLDVAIDRVRSLYQKEGRHRAPYDVVVKHWGYKPTSSSAMQAIGALNAYGLIHSEGKGQSRYIQLSERALRVVEDKRTVSDERVTALQEAALAPSIHREVWDVYGPANETSEENFETFLVREKSFNPKSAGRFIAEYKATMAFAGLDGSDILNEDEEDDRRDGGGDSEGKNEQRSRDSERDGRNKESSKMPKGSTEFAIDIPGEGRVVLHTPARMSKESVDFLKLWMERCWKQLTQSSNPQEPRNGTQRENVEEGGEEGQQAASEQKEQ